MTTKYCSECFRHRESPCDHDLCSWGDDDSRIESPLSVFFMGLIVGTVLGASLAAMLLI